MQKSIQLFTTILLFAAFSLHTAAQENLIRNGDFTGTWVPQGWVLIDDITNTTGAEFWHVQFNQNLTDDQMAALEVGETYELTFDAGAEEEKQIAVFFGEDGGSYHNLLDPDGEGGNVIELTTDVQSFSFEFEAGTFDAMKLGFEGGKDDFSFTMGHVSILKKVGEEEDAGDNIVNNGQFEAADFEDSWDIWFADWEGTTASALINDWFVWFADWEGVTVDLTIDEGWANIHNIENTPGTENWHVQFNQQLTTSQIDKLIADESYTLTFDAKAEDAKEIAVFFGEDGGSFTNLLDPEQENNHIINLTTEDQSFSFDFVGQQFDGMKLGFEGGLDDIGYSISNVVILVEDDDDTTSIYEEQLSKIIVYPNPASDKINVKANEGATIVLTNLIGSIVDIKTAESNEVTFEVGSLQSGVYLISIENKGERITKKVIVR